MAGVDFDPEKRTIKAVQGDASSGSARGTDLPVTVVMYGVDVQQLMSSMIKLQL